MAPTRISLLRRSVAMAGYLAVMAVCSAASAAEIETHLRRGDRLEPFHVKDCTGPAAGKTLCYYCRYGLRPVTAVFVREWTDQAVQLVAQVDREVDRRRTARVAAFVISLEKDSHAAEERLRALADGRRLTRTPLTLYRDAPEKIGQVFGLPASAKLAVLTWKNGQIQTIRVFDDARLSTEETARALGDVAALAR